MLVFDSRHFMTSSNLVYNKETYLWQSNAPEEAMTLSGARSFVHFSKLFGIEIDPLIPEKISKICRSIKLRAALVFLYWKSEVSKNDK